MPAPRDTVFARSGACAADLRRRRRRRRQGLPAFVMLAAAATCAAEPRPECVVLLHGLARSAASMEPMAEALRNAGYSVANVDYPSRHYPIEQLAPLAVNTGLGACRARQAARIHFVTHSLGGILLRQYDAEYAIDDLGRVVMLAPPNQGSAAADSLRDVPGFRWLNGPAGFQLGKGEESVPLELGSPSFEFAVIAGDRTIDPLTSLLLENPDDGRVSVQDTRLQGMRDFSVVHVSHAFVMRDDEVIRLVKSFLAHGRFAHARDGAD